MPNGSKWKIIDAFISFIQRKSLSSIRRLPTSFFFKKSNNKIRNKNSFLWDLSECNVVLSFPVLVLNFCFFMFISLCPYEREICCWNYYNTNAIIMNEFIYNLLFNLKEIKKKIEKNQRKKKIIIKPETI